MSDLPLAVSMGDPGGIGPDIVLQSWADRTELGLPEFVVFGDLEFLSRRSEVLGLKTSLKEASDGVISDRQHLHVVPVQHQVSGVPGKPETNDAAATIEAIKDATGAVFAGRADALVTCPINKAVLYETGFSHPGHTEFLAELCSRHSGRDERAVMMLAGPRLRTIPVTIHIPLDKVKVALTPNIIEETITIAWRDLQTRFGIDNPRIAVAGLNPHAGENGEIGREETEVIEPVIKRLATEGMNLSGPHSADTLFHEKARAAYDVAVCMYHDQALIPAKMLDFDEAVNVTLGLSIIRTSPDHGTAYDIAGTGKANPSSFVAALKLARQMADRV